jgi:hypothetical protein
MVGSTEDVFTREGKARTLIISSVRGEADGGSGFNNMWMTLILNIKLQREWVVRLLMAICTLEYDDPI